MRRFSDIEKAYIKEICQYGKKRDSDPNTEEKKLVEVCLDKYHVGTDIDDTKDEIEYRCFFYDSFERWQKVQNDIIEVAYLLFDLEKEGYIGYYANKTYEPLESFNIYCDGKITPRRVSISSVVLETLSKDVRCDLRINQSLYELVENNFKTYEDLQLDEARAQSKIAIKSLEEARIQSKKAIESLEEARIQSETAIESLKEAKKQTWWSIGALIVAVVTMFVTIAVHVCYTQSVRVEEVKSPVIQTIKKEILPKHETKKKVLPTVQPAKQDSVKLTSGNKIKRTK